ncbi:hypothetical protein NA57DRAFT_75354 [Rhizodiscina lignyota]|uniref:Uncharacterized protein n=1 Tax=Rhizodiscina lignyota TaxID=1504668 RepID=A0A9P4M7C5_9PEZI|nr:hypothetical protein NA57DRAFT_75354 [Rhizodiscina lignyota]
MQALKIIFPALFWALSGSAFPTVEDAPACTTTVFESAHFGCTQYETTVTVTSSVDCGGCTLDVFDVPHFFGVGPECIPTDIATLPITTTTDFECAASPTFKARDAKAAAPAPTPCTKDVPLRPHFQALGKTCTEYSSTMTVPVYTDCAGCTLNYVPVQEGHGPEIPCTTHITEVWTTTLPVCSPSPSAYGYGA